MGGPNPITMEAIAAYCQVFAPLLPEQFPLRFAQFVDVLDDVVLKHYDKKIASERSHKS